MEGGNVRCRFSFGFLDGLKNDVQCDVGGPEGCKGQRGLSVNDVKGGMSVKGKTEHIFDVKQ